MPEPDGSIATPQPTEATAQPSGPMSGEERASRAFQALTSGQDPDAVRAELDRESAARSEPGPRDGQPEDGGDDRSATPASLEQPAPQAGQESTDDAVSEDFLRAQAVLRRDNWTDAMIERMPRDEVLAHAEKRRKVQADVDRFGSTKTPTEQPPAESTDERTDTQPAADADPIISQIAEYDPALAEQVSAVIAESRAQVQRANRTSLDREFRETMATLQPAYPELGDEAQQARVIARAEKLAATGDYKGIDKPLETLIRHATLIEFGDRRAQQAQQDLLKRNRQARDGQVDTDTTADPDSKPLTPDEKESRIFRLLSKGATPEEARRRVTMLPDA